MVKAGDRIRLSSMKGLDREGVVIAVTGALLRVRWPSNEETTLVPAPGTLTVLVAAKPGATKPTKSKAAAKKTAGAKKTAAASAASKTGAKKTTSAKKPAGATKTTGATKTAAASATSKTGAKKTKAAKGSTR